jgi:hypothetical protein
MMDSVSLSERTNCRMCYWKDYVHVDMVQVAEDCNVIEGYLRTEWLLKPEVPESEVILESVCCEGCIVASGSQLLNYGG